MAAPKESDPRGTFFERSLDRAIGMVSPAAGLERSIARSKLREFSELDGSESSLRRSSSGGQTRNASPENWQAQKERVAAIWDARDASRKFCFVAGVLARLTMYVTNKIAYQPDTDGGKKVNEEYDEFFHDWCTRSDITGRMRLREQVEVGFWSFLCDGDFGWVMVDDAASDELRLQGIEADRIGSPVETQVGENYVGGLTIGPVGEVLSYRIFERTLMGQYINPVEIGPEQFIHLMIAKRDSQYRGVTPLAPILPHARDIGEWFASEKQAGKTASLFSAFMLPKDPYQQKGSSSATDWNGPRINDRTPTMKAQPGLVVKLENGESIQFPSIPARPSGAFMQFVEVLVREMAIGLDLPYGFVYNLAELGGVTARIEVQQAQRAISRYQDMLVDKVLERVKNAVLARGILSGAITPCLNWKKGRWQFGATLTGDVGYQTSADIQMIKMGGKSMEDWTGERGTNPREIARKNAHYVKDLQEIGAEEGVPAEMLAPDLYPQATAQLAAMNTPPEPPPAPPPGLIGEVGDKGVKQLVDILSKVTTGEIERESAIQSLVTIFGLPREQAEKLVPENPAPPPLETPTA